VAFGVKSQEKLRILFTHMFSPLQVQAFLVHATKVKKIQTLMATNVKKATPVLLRLGNNGLPVVQALRNDEIPQ